MSQLKAPAFLPGLFRDSTVSMRGMSVDKPLRGQLRISPSEDRSRAVCACGRVRGLTPHQLGPIFDQPLGSRGEDIELGATDDETKVLEQTADLVLEITLDLDQQCPARQQRSDRVAVEILDVHLLEPAGPGDAGRIV